MKMTMGFWIVLCKHALFEFPEDVNEITKNHTEAASGEFRVISLFLQNMILGAT